MKSCSLRWTPCCDDRPPVDVIGPYYTMTVVGCDPPSNNCGSLTNNCGSLAIDCGLSSSAVDGSQFCDSSFINYDLLNDCAYDGLYCDDPLGMHALSLCSDYGTSQFLSFCQEKMQDLSCKEDVSAERGCNIVGKGPALIDDTPGYIYGCGGYAVRIRFI